MGRGGNADSGGVLGQGDGGHGCGSRWQVKQRASAQVEED
jgi:hypothetical protein